MADYTIQGGDNLSRIAKAHGTDVNTLLKLNPELKKHPNSIMKGDTLKLPDAPKGAEDIDMNVPGFGIEHSDSTPAKPTTVPTAQPQTPDSGYTKGDVITAGIVGAATLKAAEAAAPHVKTAAKKGANIARNAAKAGVAKARTLASRAKAGIKNGITATMVRPTAPIKII